MITSSQRPYIYIFRCKQTGLRVSRTYAKAHPESCVRAKILRARSEHGHEIISDKPAVFKRKGQT
jgi:hypothetical protein